MNIRAAWQRSKKFLNPSNSFMFRSSFFGVLYYLGKVLTFKNIKNCLLKKFKSTEKILVESQFFLKFQTIRSVEIPAETLSQQFYP